MIFDFEGEKIPKNLIDNLSNLLKQLIEDPVLFDRLNLFLTNSEYIALKNRINFLINKPYIPYLNPFYNVPMPLI